MHGIIPTSLVSTNAPETVPETQLPKRLIDALIPSLPRAAYYVSEFVTPDEEANILQKVGLLYLSFLISREGN